eukprot:424056-Alexandrium_andersonii.AAC.1
MASRSVEGSTSTAVDRPSHAAKRPRTVGADAAPNTKTRKKQYLPRSTTTVNLCSSGDRGT